MARELNEQCAFCGAVPAANVGFTAARGLLIFVTWSRIKKPMCRDCGTTAFRTQQSVCMRFGWWWLLSFISNPIVLTRNAIANGKISALGEPVRPPANSPLEPVRRLREQPLAIVLTTVAVTAFGALVAIGVISNSKPFTHEQQAWVGQCGVERNGSIIVGEPCGDHGALKVVSLSHSTECPTGTSAIEVSNTSALESVYACVSRAEG